MPQNTHARLHRRNHSDQGAFAFSTPKVTYEESWGEPSRPLPSAPSSHSSHSHPLKIKPYLRKLSSKDANSLDLSRPAAENEGLAGLGISDYGPGGAGYARSASDVNFAPVNGRHRHTRSTSNTSQFSTSSSLQRPPAPYLPSIRQAPQHYAQPYSPPFSNSQSTPPSILGSENEADDIMSDDEFRLRQNAYDPARRSGSLSSTPGGASALRIHTNGSSTRLGGSYSQSSVSLTSPVGQARSRGDTLKSMDTAASPSTRTSFDKAFGFIRAGRDSPIDPASRAASIRAARQAFNEKEEAKERKHDKEAHRQAERDNRKQYKKEERQRRKSETLDRKDHKRSRSVSDSNNEKATPRPSIGGRQYSDHRQAHTSTLPNHVVSVETEKHGAAPKVTKSRAAKGRWLRFVTWFKTRLLRMSSRLHMA
ncbi:hypothetical protein BS50DRAFT_484384 [Corynespora cassiicola Philippines]|uniref:Pal1-domain-containing protein n=1 Tax=Corynespora cassiicola Philippines TaxID=1448308 RepID=A0A2T2P2Y4_CORCC|nr:hypothetical protein BS50DRAFT_484384 [Corynespora cassiicola Philippines]